MMAAIAFLTAALTAQSTTSPGTPAFDVASVKLNKSDDRPSANFPLGPGDIYVPNGGFLSAKNYPLITYIAFAYKIQASQMELLRPQFPAWVTTDRYDIQARAEGNPTKDEMRLMMRSLLAERFKLAIHSEPRQVSAFAVVLTKPEKTGPRLQKHAIDLPCSTTVEPQSETLAGGFPVICGGLARMPPTNPGAIRWGARDIPFTILANALTGLGRLGRPVLDETGLQGTFDFVLERTPEYDGPVQPGVVVHSDASGPTFQEALKQQLGLKLVSQKAPVDMLVLDHVEHPSEN
jgi:uncharacterized protein (TIGR03435 family)